MPIFDMFRHSWLVAGRIALFYLVFSLIWIYLGDLMLFHLIEDTNRLTRWQTYKGAFFVVLSSTLIYALILHAVKTLKREQAKAEKILSSRNTALKQRNSALKQFNYAVSHELKTPLVSIESSLGLIHSSLPQNMDPELTTAIGYARSATRQMNNLLESLLLMFQLDAADRVTGATALRALVQDAIDQLTRGGKLNGIKLTIADEGLDFCGDRNKLVQIWLHLIGNAAKYMGDQKHPAIAIGAEPVGQDIRFFVRDNGKGIEMSYQDKIFGLFDRLDKTADGTGLGLTLVKRIVEYYGGTIRVESAGAGQGSCFYFTLPDALINKDRTT
ncbi:sensor histidine kinase [Pelovirga terrestris]|uniref:histidine kinase n=1 Tax=Pelovirga terrestris TaxID=2771352 RepID=A0A8J6QPS8_9BACT|nr:HAMP domain-containing sensor histidine kinase [Pelovirga terrestris]MBD1399655.1 HAMP domain-containing histidine kinase [Pelovirga terrestris]